MRVLLKNTRMATSQKIKAEYEGRRQRNAEAVAVLEANFKMWMHVGGPRFDYLKDPSDEALHRADEAKAHLIMIKEQQADAADNAVAIAGECIRAVDALSSLDLESIRRDRFPLTPEAIFEGFVKNMRDLTRTLEAEHQRRRDWLSMEAAVADAEVDAPVAAHGDKYGCDPDSFLRPANPRMKPHGWKRAVQNASLVHIDEMRTLLVTVAPRARDGTRPSPVDSARFAGCRRAVRRGLRQAARRGEPAAKELHYDGVFTEKYFRKYRTQGGEERTATKRRKSDFKVFKSVANAHKRKLCQRIELPQSVKDLLRCPKDEENWATLQKVREEVVLIAQGLKTSTLDTADEIQELAAAISSAKASDPWNAIGEGVNWIPPGARLHLARSDTEHIEGVVYVDSRRDFLVEKVRRFEPGVRILSLIHI